MDASIAGRFYRLSEAPQGSLDFDALLLEQMQRQNPGDRERDLGGGVIMRIERCAVENGILIGDFCRKQTINIPPQAGPAGLTPIQLDLGMGIGHVAAFAYHSPTRCLFLQRNLQSATPNRIGLYLRSLSGQALFTFSPVLREDAWMRLHGRGIRVLTVKFASPENLSALDDEGIAAAKGARLMAEAYNGMEITFTISAGRKKNSILNAQAVAGTLRSLIGSSADIDNLSIKTSIEEGSEPIDMLGDQLKYAEEINIPEGNPDQHYEVRKRWIVNKFRANEDYLRRFYARGENGDAR
ncbi:hypothetical protein FF100_04035 [Methylobacterium terricola]|uniref:Uncharacterized protein n=1 Tax=Methylobacterium terricola TaxID=2583531 RepID=A0A5C4LQQ7_9HYPH|nr:DUF6731 family protein [Methylobacterium terricola]TNC16423.1 hypothetical protein FF100_04035 [Methylobacterium terricola]